VFYAWVTEYPDEAEARRQLWFAQMDVPAVLVYDEGKGWTGMNGEPIVEERKPHWLMEKGKEA